MIAVLSPAKALDFRTPARVDTYTVADHLDQADLLVRKMRRLSKNKLIALMPISEKLAKLNKQRYADYEPPLAPGPDNKQAVYAFNGDTYRGLEAASLDLGDLEFAQDHVRILSGLYGLLRPLDLIRPHRLEMGTKLSSRRGRDLYAFWGRRIADSLNEALVATGSRVVVNCASAEYFKSIDRKVLDATVVTPVFQDWSKGDYRVHGLFAKLARGAMTQYMVRARISDPADLQAFDFEGYRFNAELSDATTYVFRRRR